MQKHVLYVASGQQIQKSQVSFGKSHFVVEKVGTSDMWISHKTLGNIELCLHFLSQTEKIIEKLKNHPMDLIIYDERYGGIPYIDEFIPKLREEVAAWAQSWGRDFLFPLQRFAVIIEDSFGASERAFQLGKSQVRDVLVGPRDLLKILRWIVNLLQSGAERARIGVAMNGGGMEGYLFQLGATLAIEHALNGQGLNQAHVFSGVSSGSIVTSMLAVGLPIEEVVQSLLGKSQRIRQLKGQEIYTLAGQDLLSNWAKKFWSWSNLDPTKWAHNVLSAIPNGFFQGQTLSQYLKEAFGNFYLENDFRNLEKELYVGATLYETFEPVILGQDPWGDVSVSDAVGASCSLPLIFMPYKLKDHYFVDGEVSHSSHLELLVHRGCRLIIIIDPLSPSGLLEPGDAGGVSTLIQSLKTLVHSRFQEKLYHLTDRYPHVDFVLFQPYGASAQIMGGSPMKYRFNLKILNFAYQETLLKIQEHYSLYKSKLAKYDWHLSSYETLSLLAQNSLITKIP